MSKNGPSITHLMFANDLMFFVRVNSREMMTVKDILAKYATWFGQKINQQKSSIAFSRSTNSKVQTSLCNFMGLRKYDLAASTWGFLLFFLGQRSKLLKSSKKRSSRSCRARNQKYDPKQVELSFSRSRQLLFLNTRWPLFCCQRLSVISLISISKKFGGFR